MQVHRRDLRRLTRQQEQATVRHQQEVVGQGGAAEEELVVAVALAIQVHPDPAHLLAGNPANPIK
jgi:hypothetical protein